MEVYPDLVKVSHDLQSVISVTCSWPDSKQDGGHVWRQHAANKEERCQHQAQQKVILQFEFTFDIFLNCWLWSLGVPWVIPVSLSCPFIDLRMIFPFLFPRCFKAFAFCLLIVLQGFPEWVIPWALLDCSLVYAEYSLIVPWVFPECNTGIKFPYFYNK